MTVIAHTTRWMCREHPDLDVELPERGDCCLTCKGALVEVDCVILLADQLKGAVDRAEEAEAWAMRLYGMLSAGKTDAEIAEIARMAGDRAQIIQHDTVMRLIAERNDLRQQLQGVVEALRVAQTYLERGSRINEDAAVRAKVDAALEQRTR